MAKEFCLPDLGSGLQEGQIVSWLVEVGQEVTTADNLCEVETEKAVIEIPVPYTGTVLELRAAPGDAVEVRCRVGDKTYEFAGEVRWNGRSKTHGCVGLGIEVLEIDVHITRDGALVVAHDGRVDRTTDGTGRIEDLGYDEIRRLDAGAAWRDTTGA